MVADGKETVSARGPRSAIVLKAFQCLCSITVPRGLPRFVWATRRLWFGIGQVPFNYLGRFEAYCDTDLYHSVMFAVGIEDRCLDRTLQQLLRPGAVVFDIGANVGMVTLLMSSLPGLHRNIKVHCFEPDPGVFRMLEANSALNQHFNLVLNNVAVGAVEGAAELTVATTSGWSTLAPEPPGGFPFLEKEATKKVSVVAIDEYCKRTGEIPEVLKIDVEGFETEVLKGAIHTLRSKRPYMLLEVNPSRLQAAHSSVSELIGLCRSLGYSLYHIDPRASSRLGQRKTWKGYKTALPNDVAEQGMMDVIAVPD